MNDMCNPLHYRCRDMALFNFVACYLVIISACFCLHIVPMIFAIHPSKNVFTLAYKVVYDVFAYCIHVCVSTSIITDCLGIEIPPYVNLTRTGIEIDDNQCRAQFKISVSDLITFTYTVLFT